MEKMIDLLDTNLYRVFFARIWGLEAGILLSHAFDVQKRMGEDRWWTATPEQLHIVLGVNEAELARARERLQVEGLLLYRPETHAYWLDVEAVVDVVNNALALGVDDAD